MLSNEEKFAIAQMVVNKTLSRRQACARYEILLSSLQYYCKRVRLDTEVLNHPGRHRIIDSIRDCSLRNDPLLTELTLKKFILRAAKDTYNARHHSKLDPHKLRSTHKYISRSTLNRYIALYKPFCRRSSCNIQ